MKNFLELTVITSHLGSELVSDILSEYTEYGVAISDVQDVIDLERNGKYWDYADESVYSADKTVLVKAFYPIDEAKSIVKEIETRLSELKQLAEFDVGTLETVKREIDGDKWREQWKEHFKPIRIGRVVVVPEWIDYEKQDGDVIVLLDSNMAFGTGEHETTSMCIEFLEKYVKADDTVLDVGSGSGILGIAASKLGAKRVVLTDIDECAVTASRHNLALNKVDNGEAILKNLLDDTTVKGDVIVCNIVAEVLIGFARYIGNNLNDGGIVILSGILSDRTQKVIDAYTANGFCLRDVKTKGEWSACVFLKGNAQ